MTVILLKETDAVPVARLSTDGSAPAWHADFLIATVYAAMECAQGRKSAMMATQRMMMDALQDVMWGVDGRAPIQTQTSAQQHAVTRNLLETRIVMTATRLKETDAVPVAELKMVGTVPA